MEIKELLGFIQMRIDEYGESKILTHSEKLLLEDFLNYIFQDLSEED